MPTRLFLVHGMGEFDANWTAKTEAQIDELYTKYETLAAVERQTRFTIHPVVYDDVLRDLVKRWQTDSNAISDLAIGATPKLAEALVGWLKTAGTGFQWTHAADVLLYRLFSDVREAVIVHWQTDLRRRQRRHRQLRRLPLGCHRPLAGHRRRA